MFRKPIFAGFTASQPDSSSSPGIELREKFQQSHRNILRMAAHKGVALSIPSMLISE